MKFLSLAALALVSAASWGQDLSGHVSFACRATVASRALAQLSDATHLKLEANPQMAGEVLVIAASDVPLDELLKRIATATSGEWEKNGAGFLLKPDVATRNQEERARYDRRLQGFRDFLAQQLKQMDEAAKAAAQPAQPDKGKPGDGDADDGPPMGVDSVDPDQQAVLRLVQTVGPETLAGLELGGRVVFASNPNSLQRALPAGAASIVEDYVKAHNAQVVPGMADVTPPDDGDGQPLPPEFKAALERRIKPIAAPAKALLVLSRTDGLTGMASMLHPNGIEAQMVLYDRAGSVIAETTNMIDDASDAGRGQGPAGPDDATNKPAPAVESGTPVDYSEDSKAFMASFGKMMATAAPTIPADLRAKLAHPDQNDPLSFMSTDELLAVAKKIGKPLVADIPDDVLSLGGEIKPLTVEQVQKDLAAAKEEAIVPDNGWLVVKPAKPVDSREDRLDRTALTTLIAAAAAKGSASLDDVANYATNNPRPTMESGFSFCYLLMLAPGSIDLGFSGQSSDWNMLRFYGSLPPAERQAFLSSGKAPFSSFSPSSLESLLFGASAKLNLDQSAPASPKSPMPLMFGMMPDFDSSYLEEPTEAMPNGIPAGGYIEIQTSSEPVESVVSNDLMNGMIFDATMLAMLTSQADMGVSGPPISKIKVGERKSYVFVFHVAPGVSMKKTLTDNHVAPDAAIASLTDLPADLKSKVEEAKKQWKTAMAGATGKGPGQTP